MFSMLCSGTILSSERCEFCFLQTSKGTSVKSTQYILYLYLSANSLYCLISFVFEAVASKTVNSPRDILYSSKSKIIFHVSCSTCWFLAIAKAPSAFNSLEAHITRISSGHKVYFSKWFSFIQVLLPAPGLRSTSCNQESAHINHLPFLKYLLIYYTIKRRL